MRVQFVNNSTSFNQETSNYGTGRRFLNPECESQGRQFGQSLIVYFKREANELF